MAGIDSSIGRSLASPSAASTRQNTVSRMISGGSAGFRTMIALPACARRRPCSIARAVVSVNSSMFARVPGPADLEAIEATISA